MAVALTPTDIADLVTLTYDTMLKKSTWNDISLTLQHFTIADRFFKGQQANIDTGPQVTWKLQIANPDNVQLTGLYDEDVYDVRDLMISATQDWAMIKTNWAWDVREQAFQSDNEMTLVKYIETRRHAMFNDWFKFLERKFWSAPTAPPSVPGQVFDICGIPWWIQQNATEGFNGGNPSGFSSGRGGVSTSSYPTWANWTGTYRAVNPDDLFSKMDTACDYCEFVAPDAYPTTSSNQKPQYVFYTTQPITQKARKFLQSRRDDIKDLSSVTDLMFRSFPFTRVPALDNSSEPTYASNNPVYGINWNSAKLYFQNSQNMRRTEPRPKDNSHNVWAEHFDSTLQLIFDDLRSNFVLYQS